MGVDAGELVDGRGQAGDGGGLLLDPERAELDLAVLLGRALLGLCVGHLLGDGALDFLPDANLGFLERLGLRVALELLLVLDLRPALGLASRLLMKTSNKVVLNFGTVDYTCADG